MEKKSKKAFWSENRIRLGDSGGAWVVFFRPDPINGKDGKEEKTEKDDSDSYKIAGIRLGGSLTIEAASRFAEEYNSRGEILKQFNHLIVELSDVTWFGSTMISELIRVYRQRDENLKQWFWVCGMIDSVDDILRTVGCGQIFCFEKSLDDVLRKIEQENL